ncbi:hypothetical protein J6590_108106, partial [Homalodisca vitripennis]
RNDAQQQLSKCPSKLSAQGRTNFKDVRQNTAISRIVLADVRECAKLRGSHMFCAARRSSVRSVWTYLKTTGCTATYPWGEPFAPLYCASRLAQGAESLRLTTETPDLS